MIVRLAKRSRNLWISKNKLPKDFDRQAYLALNPDVAALNENPERHFLNFGRAEKRLYSTSHLRTIKLPSDFDERVYLELNPDVAQAQEPAARHYRLHGKLENRPYRNDSKLTELLPEDFDEQCYLELNPDLIVAKIRPREHYIDFGRREGRRYKHDTTSQDSLAFYTPPQAVRNLADFPITSKINGLVKKPKIIAFYLPQYHQIKENDQWWGRGFTEWTNVRKAKPNFRGHIQPHIPLDKNYYDLADTKVQEDQSALAEAFGVDAFCYYMYWFNGRRVLERPLDQMLSNSRVTTEFCICWANENWTRTWDGRADNILLEQKHSPESDRQFIRDAMKYLSDPRYLRIDGKLMLLVYRVDLIPNCSETAAIWREEVRAAGLGDLHLCAVQFYGIDDPTPWGFDAAVEFPPHGWLVQSNLPDNPAEVLNKDFIGQVFDYSKSIDHAMSKSIPSYIWYRTAFPGWDNTARRQNTPHIFANNRPDLFEKWLTLILEQQILFQLPEHRVVFVNAWNEWGEGAHLEPDEHFRYGNLEAVSHALVNAQQNMHFLNALQRLSQSGNYDLRQADALQVLNSFKGYEQSLRENLSKGHSSDGARGAK